MRRKRIKFLCAIFLVCLTLEQIIFRDLPFVAVGLWNKEAFFEGRPTCYWKLQVERYQGLIAEQVPQTTHPLYNISQGITPTVTMEGLGRPPYSGDKIRPIGRNVFLVISNYVHYFHESLPDKPAILLAKPNSVPVLAQLLDQDNFLVSREACRTLRLLASEGDDEALTALKGALSKERPWVRLYAGDALLNVAPAHKDDVLPVALAGLNHPWYHPQAEHLLAKIATRTWRISNDDPSIFVELPYDRTVSRLLELLEADDASSDEAGDALVAAIGEAAIPALIDILQQADQRAQSRAAWTLAKMGIKAKSAIPLLVSRLESDNAEVRFSAAFALGQIGPKAREAVPSLIRLLDDNDWNIRYVSIYALGQMGQEAKPAIPALKKALKDENPKIRDGAAQALTRIE